MRRFWILTLTALLLAGMLAIPAAAEGIGSAALTPGSGSAGSTAAMTLSLKDFGMANTIGVEIILPEGLTVNKEKSQWLPEGQLSDIGDNRAAWAANDPLDVDTDVLELVVNIPEGAAVDTVYTVQCRVQVKSNTELLGSAEVSGQITVLSPSVPMHRMYDPNSGEHFYTGADLERDFLVAAGWHYEGVGFNFPREGAPVHRLYEPVHGEHLYTMDEAEMNKLLGWGWSYEGVAFNSAGSDAVPQHRLHNPNAKRGGYHFTGSEIERDILISVGWIYEGIGWYSCVE